MWWGWGWPRELEVICLDRGASLQGWRACGALPIPPSPLVSSVVPFLLLAAVQCYMAIYSPWQIQGVLKFALKSWESHSLENTCLCHLGLEPAGQQGWEASREERVWCEEDRETLTACWAPTGWTPAINRRNTKLSVFNMHIEFIYLMKNFPGKESWAVRAELFLSTM